VSIFRTVANVSIVSGQIANMSLVIGQIRRTGAANADAMVESRKFRSKPQAELSTSRSGNVLNRH